MRASLTNVTDPNTFADMKDATLTIRLPSATRRKVESYARRQQRSLSQAAEHLIELGLGVTRSAAGQIREQRAPTWGATEVPAGSLAGGLVPTLDDFRAVRGEMDDAFARRTRGARRRR